MKYGLWFGRISNGRKGNLLDSVFLFHRVTQGKFRYGQQQYDFDEGLLSFISPEQSMLLEIETEPGVKPTG